MADPTTGLDPQAMQFIQGQQPTDTLGKIGAFFAHPAVQGALAAYLGAIGTPRSAGFGAALSRGGLAGLGAFGQAEQLEQKLPLERAQALEAMQKIPLEQAQTSLAGARAKVANAQAGQYVPEPQLSQQMSILSQNTQDPTMSATYALISEGLKNGSMRSPDAAKILSTAAMSGARVALAQAQTEVAQQTGALRQEQTKLLPGEIGARIGAENASAARAMAGVGEENATAALRNTQRDQLVKTGGEKPAAPAIEYGPGGETKRTRSMTHDPGYSFIKPTSAAGQLAKINTDLGRFVTANPLHIYSHKEEWVKDATDYAAAQNPGIDRSQIEQAARALGRVPASGAPSASTPNTPAGATKAKVAADLGL